MQNILRPIVESAGYRVVTGSGQADIIIESADRDPSVVDGAENVVRIRSQLDAEDGDDSIYRYDRAGLLAALSRRAAGGKK